MKLMMFDRYSLSQMAMHLLYDWDLKIKPINIEQLAEGKGLSVDNHFNSVMEYEVFLSFNPRKININTKMPSNMSGREEDNLWLRVRIAQGIAHFYLNREYFKQFNIKTEKDYLTARANNPQDFHLADSQARIFAQHLLIPNFLLDMDDDVYGGSLFDLARSYQVPVRFMEARLREREL